jgi:hypothetical protein
MYSAFFQSVMLLLDGKKFQTVLAIDVMLGRDIKDI